MLVRALSSTATAVAAARIAPPSRRQWPDCLIEAAGEQPELVDEARLARPAFHPRGRNRRFSKAPRPLAAPLIAWAMRPALGGVGPSQASIWLRRAGSGNIVSTFALESAASPSVARSEMFTVDRLRGPAGFDVDIADPSLPVAHGMR